MLKCYISVLFNIINRLQVILEVDKLTLNGWKGQYIAYDCCKDGPTSWIWGQDDGDIFNKTGQLRTARKQQFVKLDKILTLESFA